MDQRRHEAALLENSWKGRGRVRPTEPESADSSVERLPAHLVERNAALGTPVNLRRADHRSGHLDDLERAWLERGECSPPTSGAAFTDHGAFPTRMLWPRLRPPLRALSSRTKRRPAVGESDRAARAWAEREDPPLRQLIHRSSHGGNIEVEISGDTRRAMNTGMFAKPLAHDALGGPSLAHREGYVSRCA